MDNIIVDQGAPGEATIGTREMRQPHVAVIAMEGLTAGASYEFELVRHFEGIPTAEANTRELRSFILPEKYASPLHVLRKAQLKDHVISPYEYYMQRGIYLRGLWDLPILSDLKTVLNFGLDKIQKTPAVS